MKKFLGLLLTVLFLTVLAACGSGEEAENAEQESGETTETTELVVGATSIPHAEILEEAAPLLEEQGITLDIQTYTDYSLLNQDLVDGRLDANYFQHIPYLETQKEEFDYDITNIGGVHIEPMGIYSKSFDSMEEVPEGTDVIMSRNVPDHGRILSLFEENGLITLAEGVDKTAATVEDIVENPKNLNFTADVDPGFLPEVYDKEEEALVAINTNFALEADLVPTEDALLLEGEKSPYVNLIVVKAEDADNEALNTLVDVLHSEDIQTFIEEKYEGAVIPAATEPTE